MAQRFSMRSQAVTDDDSLAAVQSLRLRVTDHRGQLRDDDVTVEAPLEIRLHWRDQAHTATVTMRTPGDDAALAVGFLLAEKVIADVSAIRNVRACGDSGQVIRVTMNDDCTPRLQSIARNFAATSSCGLCGKTSFENIDASVADACTTTVASDCLQWLPARLRDSQLAFRMTGGIHAVASFTADGELVRLFEDIGRHNAFDKLIGASALAGETLSDRVVVLSGRAGYEMVQKSAAAGVPIVAAIGAPSSLAVEIAIRAGITLIGFLRQDRFNIYSHPQRVLPESVALIS